MLGWQLDFVILEVFSNLNDSMISDAAKGAEACRQGWVRLLGSRGEGKGKLKQLAPKRAKLALISSPGAAHAAHLSPAAAASGPCCRLPSCPP